MLTQGRRASVVNTASLAGLVAAPTMAPYSASKFGVVGMSEALYAELAPRGIHVAAVCPGIINTAITRTAIMRGEQAGQRDQTIRFYERRGASPDRVAEAVVEAVRKRKLIVPVPSLHVTPLWMLKRLAPRVSSVIARNLPKLVNR
jgi:short-subunit dehydrogenase